MITVKKHKGRSGISVFEYRVYRVTELNPGRIVTTQLGKYRTESAANAAAEHYRANDARVQTMWNKKNSFACVWCGVIQNPGTVSCIHCNGC